MTVVYGCGSRVTCTKTFASLDALKSHCEAKKHVNPGVSSKLFQCKICTNTFLSSESLATHQQSACAPPSKPRKKKKIPCEICKRRFKTVDGLECHIKQPGRSHSTFACKLCEQSFATSKGLETHTKALHRAPSATTTTFVTFSRCSLCPLVFNTAQELAEHTQFTHKRFPCTLCKRGFGGKGGLRSHTKAMHPSPLKLTSAETKAPVNLTCRVCERSFLTAEGLEMHTLSPGKSHKFECKLCQEKFKTKHDLDTHGKDVQHAAAAAAASVKPVCKECKRWFKTSEGLTSHIKATEHNNDANTRSTTDLLKKKNQSIANRPRDMKCVFCTDMFKSPSGIAHHIESGVHKYHRHHVTAAVQAMGIVPQITVKDGTEPPIPTITTYVATSAAFNGSAYECFICQGTFKTLPALNSHLNSAAHDAAEFKCPKCSREFSLISGLVQHLESRCCGLAPLIEIDGYFNKLEDQFSRTMVSRQIDV